MRLIILLFHLAACAAGISAFVVAMLLYIKHRRKSILFYALFLGAIGLEVGALLYPAMGAFVAFRDQRAESTMRFMAGLCEFLSITSFPAITLFFVHYSMCIPIDRYRRILYVSLPVVSVLAYAAWRISEAQIYLHGILLPLAYGAGIYVFVIIFSHLSTIGDPLLKKAIKAFLITSGIYLPVYMMDSLAEIISRFPLKHTYTVSLPLYYLILSSLSIFFAVKYFDQPAYMDGGRLTEHFKDRFNISKRELEIVSQVITGLSNREIADKLFISFKTVENHLYNIYQKTGVRNRVQLNNLIQTNQKG